MFSNFYPLWDENTVFLIGTGEKMLSPIKFSYFILLAFISRCVILGASFGDALALLSLASLFGFLNFMEYKKEPPINEDIKKDLDLCKKEVSELKTFISAIKLNNQFRK